MPELNKKEVELFEKLIQMTEKQVLKVMKQYLANYYKKMYTTKSYVVAIGEIPIGIVAHMDTVFDDAKSKFKAELFYDREKEVMFSPDGAGFDDRAGIFMVIKLIKDGFRPTIILTTGEESGAIGASKLVNKMKKIPNLRYLVELDRSGVDDCVFYSCYNPKFIKYVEKFGFKEAIGSFSDISVLAPAWGIAAVNLSIGYFDEHSYSEHLRTDIMMITYGKLKDMLSESIEDIPKFKYKKDTRFSIYQPWSGGGFTDYCDCCNKEVEDWELIPIKNGEKRIYCCSDCVKKYNLMNEDVFDGEY